MKKLGVIFGGVTCEHDVSVVSGLQLIENVDKITFNFSGNSFKVYRKQIEETYLNYNDIIESGINKDNFNKYLEKKMNDNDFVEKTFNKIFIN